MDDGDEQIDQQKAEPEIEGGGGIQNDSKIIFFETDQMRSITLKIIVILFIIIII